ncbi:murein L,D-transpeptidase [Pseudaminobacter sp. 19-2017]|uniref:Murein L,D-transpeptidase n=1 Tax=Pseudaminobacter soli (ex Zhang et al. 2022) TaxID=2831468 RepID=A0A942E4U1_9HYPH|nr:L,D-transpeptidase [Pseudaminobacter soli]MBS3651175.1 murein L,D-transpeptidase [Pseudaminobacter soli]
MRQLAIAFSAVILMCSYASGADLTPQAVNTATPSEWDKEGDGPDPFIVRVQVLLDRARFSPGVIDGVPGDNLKEAVGTFEEFNDLQADGQIDEKFWAAIQRDNGPALTTYTITEADQNQLYVRDVPEDYGEMARMEWLGYSGPREMLAARFHMDEDLLAELNPHADFARPGTRITIAAVERPAEAKVSRIAVERKAGRVLAFGEGGELVAAYPASIGSTETPTPSGSYKVKGVAKEPPYSYDPKKNFQQGHNTKPLELPPGPKNPVGLVWIDLSKPTYGIHGTPNPALVGKTQSHGCVRLTNWDAIDLSRRVKPGVPVEFR